MTMQDVLATVKYVTDAQGEKTDVIIPLVTWKALLASWEQLIEKLEDQEDKDILQDWLEKRAKGELDMITLEDLEIERIASS